MNQQPDLAKPKVTAKDFFLYLGVVVTLYWSAISLVRLLVEVIDIAIPDAVNGYYSYGYTDGIRWTIASLIILFPLFIFLSWLVQRGLLKDISKRELWVRKWLLWLTLFLSGIAIVTDLIVFLNSFLGGELTMRFAMKVVAVLLVAAAIFGYYIWELLTVETTPWRRKLYVVVASLAILASLVAGFLYLGSPFTQREMRFDETRVSDLQNIQWQIINYWQNKGKLPLNLTELADPISGQVIPIDSETGEAYEYRDTSVAGVPSFSLCATFSLEDTTDASMGRYPEKYPAAPAIRTSPEPFVPPYPNWQHPAGRYCFSRTIDADLYPVRQLVK